MNFISKITKFFTREKEVPRNWGASIEQLKKHIDLEIHLMHSKMKALPDILKLTFEEWEKRRDDELLKLNEEFTRFEKLLKAQMDFFYEINSNAINRHWEEIKELKDSVDALKKKNKVSTTKKKPVGRPGKDKNASNTEKR